MSNHRWPRTLIHLGVASGLLVLVGCQASSTQPLAAAHSQLPEPAQPVKGPSGEPIATMALPANTPPERVAATFAVAYVTYRPDDPGPAYRATTTSPYATATLSSSLAIPIPGAGEAWRDVITAAVRARATVDGVHRPDGAPFPNETADFILALTRITTGTRARNVDHPAAYTRLVRTPDGWRVAALLN